VNFRTNTSAARHTTAAHSIALMCWCFIHVHCALLINKQCDEKIRPAVAFAVSNTVVADSLEDARDLCFNRNERVKVCVDIC
jgi:SMC proteins Flexible Hinge Domain